MASQTLPNHDERELVKMAAFGNLEGIQELFQRSDSNGSTTINIDAHGDTRWGDNTALQLAASGGHLDIVQLLIGRGADIKATDGVGMTSLHLAACSGHLTVLNHLLGQIDYDLDTMDRRDSQHGTIILYMASIGHDEMVQTLLERGADIHAPRPPLSTPLHTAATLANFDIGLALAHGDIDGMLTRLYADVDSHNQDIHFLQKGETPLHGAARMGNVKLVQLLLDKSANVNAQDDDGRTPLFVAMLYRGDNHMIVRLLLQHKADMISAVHLEGGSTPLHVVAIQGRASALRLLLENGADVHSTDEDGETPLHYVAYCDGEKTWGKSCWNMARIYMREMSNIALLYIMGHAAASPISFAYLLSRVPTSMQEMKEGKHPCIMYCTVKIWCDFC